VKVIQRYIICFLLVTIVPGMVTAQYKQIQRVKNARWSNPPALGSYEDPNVLALSDKVMVVGSYQDWADASGANLMKDAGSVSVQIKQADGTFKEIQILTSPNRQSLGHFGYAVAASGDYVAVGAPHEQVAGKANVGAVYIYKFDGSKLNLVWTLLGSTFDDKQSAFGIALAMDGTNLVVSNDYRDPVTHKPVFANVSVFTRLIADMWIKKQVLVHRKSTVYDVHEAFGYRLAIDGGVILVGAHWSTIANPWGTGFCVFELDGANWIETQRGVGGGWGPRKRAFAVDGEYLFLGPAEYEERGPVRVYKKNGAAWKLHQIMTASDKDNSRDSLSFGESLDVSDGVAVIGAAYNDTDATAESPGNRMANTGSAYIFKLDPDGYWRQHQKITADIRVKDTFFGTRIATSGGVVAISEGNRFPGIYIFQKVGIAEKDYKENRTSEVLEVLYPNPVTGAEHLQITPSADRPVRMVTIHDRAGMIKVSSQQLTDIDVSVLVPGDYFVHVIYTDGKVNKHHLRKK
jgi:hypothetical protein